MSDLISRKAAIKAIDDLPNCYNGYSDTYDKAYIIGVLEELPSVEKHGRWILDDEYDDFWRCSECGYEFVIEGTDIPTYFYCPNCGAKMDEVEK